MPENDQTKRYQDQNRSGSGDTAAGTGIGAAGGGVAGAAIGTAVGGPVGTAVGAVIGAVTGGLAGAGIADAVDSDAEDRYWRENHSSQPYAKGREYDSYAPAYRTGYHGYGKYGQKARFEDAEPSLRKDYESWWKQNTSSAPAKAPSWDEARDASRAAWDRVHRGEAARMQLSEEQVNIGKREVETGAVKLHKVVKTETVNQPVDLKREEIVVERVPAGTPGAVPDNAFQEGEIRVPLKQEQAVVEKSAHVTGEVRLRKDVQHDTKNVQETVRKEDVRVEREGDARIERDRPQR